MKYKLPENYKIEFLNPLYKSFKIKDLLRNKESRNLWKLSDIPKLISKYEENLLKLEDFQIKNKNHLGNYKISTAIGNYFQVWSKNPVDYIGEWKSLNKLLEHIKSLNKLIKNIGQLNDRQEIEIE